MYYFAADHYDKLLYFMVAMKFFFDILLCCWSAKYLKYILQFIVANVCNNIAHILTHFT